MAPLRLLFAAALVSVHSFVPAFALDDPATITTSPKARRTPSAQPDIEKRAASPATTYETNYPLPLTSYHYPYDQIPEQVNPYPVGRGPQSGYNRCNSTTEGPESQCQTMEVNTLADFCLWGSPYPNGVIGNVEAAVVAYCTQKGHGGRLIPAGSITAAQFMRTSAYIQITGLFNQTGIELQANDTGGELDPHGADQMGNPLGALVYSTGLPSGDNTTLQQAISWNNFVGSGQFCIKVCDPSVVHPNYCYNAYDLIGCDYNMPAAYAPNEFTSCEGELQDVVGTYTSDGAVYTWSQPGSLSPNTVLPWQPRIPASSNCITYSSEQLFGTPSTSAASTTGTNSAQQTGSSSSGSAGPKPTGGSTNGASKVVVGSGLFAILGAAAVLLV